MANRIEQIKVPDLSGTSADVIEVLVHVGDSVAKDHSLITLEGEKATMEVPSPFAGVVKSIQIKVGDKVESDAPILTLELAESVAASDKPKPSEKPAPPESTPKPESTSVSPPSPKVEKVPEKIEPPKTTPAGTSVHAGPGVRRMARELGVDLSRVTGSGQKGRIVKEDVQIFVKQQLKIAASGGTRFTEAMPAIDFSKFGSIEHQSLSKIKKVTGINLSRNWNTIPHVTQLAEADITELEAFRNSQKEYAAKHQLRLTPLAFIMKAVVSALQAFPTFNASLDPIGESLILKKYFHLGVAVDTPSGLVVPVIRDVDKKGIFELAKELAAISEKARSKGLTITDMQGGCFSISSLGGIGGTAFTPIVNAPEVAILGVSRTQWKAIFDESGNSRVRLMLPLSLSYDHRVVDGADGARFVTYLSDRLSDIRTLLL